MIGFWASRELGQGLDLHALHVARDDEEDQVGMPGDVVREGLADLAADLVDPRGVDDDQPGPLQARTAERTLLPSLGGADNGRPVRGADLEDLLADQGIQDGGLAPADHAERGDLDGRLIELLGQFAELPQLVGQRGLFLGRELEPGEGLLQALARPLDGLVRFLGGGLSVEFVEQFVQLLVAGHGTGPLLSAGSDGVFAPLGRPQQVVILKVVADELEREWHPVAAKPDRE